MQAFKLATRAESMKVKMHNDRYFDGYFSRYPTLPQLIPAPPPEDMVMSIIIPSYREPNLVSSLSSLGQCLPPTKPIEVLVVINSSEQDSSEVIETNRASRRAMIDYAREGKPEWLHLQILDFDRLPAKTSGVGAARKIGMDEAARRFALTRVRGDGLLICFDADTTCDPNYLQVMENYTLQITESPGCSIYFEHPIEGLGTQEERDAIAGYELHLRYYIHAMRWCGFPYAFHTVGSAMAARVWAYQRQGGMNRRKAGEDFYFLNKIIPLGKFTEIKETQVWPSPRSSDRVPFGTGRAVGNWLKGDPEAKTTYNFASFCAIKRFMDEVEFMRNEDWTTKNLPPMIQNFLEDHDFLNALRGMRQHSTHAHAFRGRLFRWFDAFRIMKCLHFARDSVYPNTPIETAAKALLNHLHSSENVQAQVSPTLFELLRTYRDMDCRRMR